MNVAVFSYYYLPIINGVVLTIRDWREKAIAVGDSWTIFVPYAGAKSVYPYVHAYPAIPLYQRFGITIPAFPEQSVDSVFAKASFDLIHVHHPSFIGTLAVSFKKKYHIPLVYTYHTRVSDYIRTYFPFLSRHIVRFIIRIFLVRFINQSNAVTVANQLLLEELVRMGVTVPIYIVPPGVPTKVISSGDRLKTRKRFGIQNSQTVLLYVGRLAKEKNIYFLLKAFVRLYQRDQTLTFILAGNGMEEEGIRRFIKKYNIEGAVLLATHETPNTIPNIYAMADMFMYASQTETYGRVLVEAMAAKLPVVVLNAPSVIGILQDKVNGRIVYKKTLSAFIHTVQEVLSDKKMRDIYAAAGQTSVMAEHDSSVSWRKLSFVYQRVLETKNMDSDTL